MTNTSSAASGLTLDDLATLCARHGSDLSNWPDQDRAAAEALIAQSSEAAALLQQEIQLSAVVAAAMPPVDEAALSALSRRIAAAAHGLPQASGIAPRVLTLGDALALVLKPVTDRLGRWVALAMPAGGLATLAVIGFVLGSSPVMMPASEAYAAEDSFDLTQLAFGNPMADFEGDWP